MQYPYHGSTEEIFETFEDEMRHRLNAIQERLDMVCGSQELIQELVRRGLRQTPGMTQANPLYSNTNNNNLDTNKKPYFYLTTYLDETTETSTVFQVSGKTFDIRDRLKSFGQASFIKENKAWEFAYDSEIYEKIKEYLTSLTNEVHETTKIIPAATASMMMDVQEKGPSTDF